MKSLIIGVGSQDAVFLLPLLKQAGHSVVGVRNVDPKFSPSSKRRLAFDRIENVNFSEFDSIKGVFEKYDFDCIFNLVGFSSVQKSFQEPVVCQEINFIFFQRILEVVREIKARCHIVQCSSSEMYGDALQNSINESSALAPVSPYGVSKAAAHLLSKVYRDSYGIKVSNAILFNHESEFRPSNFFTKRAILGVLEVYRGRVKKMQLEKIDFERDWSHAEDVARALMLIATSPNPSDYVVASGKLKSGRDFLQSAIDRLDMRVEIDEICSFENSRSRPRDHSGVIGDSTKIRLELGWKPQISFQEIVNRMIEYEMQIKN